MCKAIIEKNEIKIEKLVSKKSSSRKYDYSWVGCRVHHETLGDAEVLSVDESGTQEEPILVSFKHPVQAARTKSSFWRHAVTNISATAFAKTSATSTIASSMLKQSTLETALETALETDSDVSKTVAAPLRVAMLRAI